MYLIRVRKNRQARIDEKEDFVNKCFGTKGISMKIYYELIEELFPSHSDANRYIKEKNIDAKVYKLKEFF